MPSNTAALLAQVDEAFDRPSWHGTNLKGSIRGLTARQAAWRPRPGRHSIWELTLHAAYWKYIVWRRLAGATRGSFALAGSNWFPTPRPATAAAWRAGKALLAAEHRRLRALRATLPASQLPRKPRGSQLSRAGLIRGIAAHDLYHAGQIQLLKRLQNGRRRR